MRHRSDPTCSCRPTPNATGPSGGCRPATAQHRRYPARSTTPTTSSTSALPPPPHLATPPAAWSPLHPRQRRRHHEVIDHGPRPSGLGPAHDDVMVRHHRRVDPDRHHGTTVDDALSRALSFSRTRPPAPRSKSSPPADTGHEREGPRARSPSTTRSSRRHPTEHAGAPRRATRACGSSDATDPPASPRCPNRPDPFPQPSPLGSRTPATISFTSPKPSRNGWVSAGRRDRTVTPRLGARRRHHNTRTVCVTGRELRVRDRVSRAGEDREATGRSDAIGMLLAPLVARVMLSNPRKTRAIAEGEVKRPTSSTLASWRNCGAGLPALGVAAR
jgi:hypothetical protein